MRTTLKQDLYQKHKDEQYKVIDDEEFEKLMQQKNVLHFIVTKIKIAIKIPVGFRSNRRFAKLWPSRLIDSFQAWMASVALKFGGKLKQSYRARAANIRIGHPDFHLQPRLSFQHSGLRVPSIELSVIFMYGRDFSRPVFCQKNPKLQKTYKRLLKLNVQNTSEYV